MAVEKDARLNGCSDGHLYFMDADGLLRLD